MARYVPCTANTVWTIFSRSYANPNSHQDNLIGVLVVASPRSMQQLGLESTAKRPRFIEVCLRKAKVLALLLAIEDGNYPPERLPCQPIPLHSPAAGRSYCSR
jgi:hypothetical protein